MYEKTAVIFRVPAHNDIAGQKRELMRGDMEKMGIIKTMARAVPALAAAAALTLGASAAELVPVGEAVGLEVQTEGMLVAGLTAVETAGGEELCPAADCGVEPGDIITRLGSREVLTAEDFAAAAAELDGGEVSLTLQRSGKTIQYSIAPVRAASGEWRLGLLLRDGMSGIGTVTYYDPATGSYGALGHSINDPASGSELPLGGGTGGLRVYGFSGGQCGAFHHSDLADTVGQALGQQAGVVLYRFREGLVFQPYAGKNVTRLQNQQRAHADGFQHSRIQ